MEALCGLSLDQDKDNITALQCMHAKAAFHFGGNWDSHWTIGDIEDTDASYKVECNLDLSLQQLRDDRLFLAAYQKDSKPKTEISFLFQMFK